MSEIEYIVVDDDINGTENINECHKRKLSITDISETPSPKRIKLGKSSNTALKQEKSDEEVAVQREAVKRRKAEREKARREYIVITEGNENTALIRREANRLRMANARSEENENAALIRREANRLRMANARSKENENAALIRRETNRLKTANARSTENEDAALIRREANRLRQATARVAKWSLLKNEAFKYDSNLEYENYHIIGIGGLTAVCPHCNAKKWIGETPGMCCSGGKVLLPALQEPPEPLKSFMDDITDSNNFLKNIRKYNSCFQMTSFGTTNAIPHQGFMPTFKIQGQIYHRFGSLLPLPNEDPKFLQIYFMGNEEAQVNQRINCNPGTNQNTVLAIQRMLHTCNTYVTSFKTVLDQLPTDDMKIVIRADMVPLGQHERTYNAPVVNEVAIILEGNDFGSRDIILQKRDNKLQRISETHRSYDALQYPILFPRGENGYSICINQRDPITKLITNKFVSSKDFYSFRIMIRDTPNYLLLCRQLFHQFLVDMFAKIECERLLYIRLNQTKLRSEEYVHLRDAIAIDGQANNHGKLVILPSTFTGGPRYMHEYTQDSIAYVRNYGKPDLFITFTCNPKWKEIKDELLPGQSHSDRHDLIARVFRQKLIKFIQLITKGEIFGPVNCWVSSTEWQKRGLPHNHLLFWLSNKIDPNHIDRIIRAEIPDPDLDPKLYKTVIEQMVHGPCGNINPNSPCMKDGKCTKRYPKSLLLETQSGKDGYPLYRRRQLADGGFEVTKKIKRGYSFVEYNIDNKWIVPYCPLLSRMFDAHINIEYCNSVKSIKYVLKYIHKGSDQAVFGIQNDGKSIDEIEGYRAGRYISSNEAVWRILDFPVHERYPSVMQLSVHLENGQRVYFNAENVHQKVQQPPNTTLIGFFKLCRNDDFAKTLLYFEVPKYYTWDKTKKVFNRRKQGVAVVGFDGIKSSDVLGRVYSVHPNNFECFYLRILLHTVRGPTSFDDLKTVDGQVCATFREACQKLGLLENDNQWHATMAETVESKSPHKIRSLFIILITSCSPANPQNLWDTFKESMSEDILSRIRQQNPGLQIDYNADIFNEVLIMIEDKIIDTVGKTLQEFGFSCPSRKNVNRLQTEILKETAYNTHDLEHYIADKEPLLVQDQRIVYDIILNRVKDGTGGLFFIDAPGGTGKTFVINLLLSKIRFRSDIAIAMASSGIAATLLQGGRTAHSTLKLPLDLARAEEPICNISKGTGKAAVLQQCKLIVWDECTMIHKHGLEALNRSLQDIRDNPQLMGGAVVVLAGDFRQTLPIIPRGTMADELKACLKSSQLWRHVETFKLTTNMRVHLQQDVNAKRFADQLLALGNGRLSKEPNTDTIKLPKDFCNIVNTIEELQDKVFPNIEQNYKDHSWLCQRAILAPTNESVNKINFDCQKKMPGQEIVYKSMDTVIDTNEAVHYPTEFLNSLNPSGMPSHLLSLKVGSPIVLLRNLDAPRLCNGTRLCIKFLRRNIIEATILTGCAKGEDVFIPRIPLIPSDTPFEFKRLQFPIRLAFAMSINKAQGQSLKFAGIDLRSDCFSHGQLYVAMSRVGSPDNLYVLANDGKTRNVVYYQALNKK